MARLSKVEECLICERLPCECSGTKKPKPRPKKTETPTPLVEQAEPVAAPVVRASMRDKMKAAAAAGPVSPTTTLPAVRTPASSGRQTPPPQPPPDPNPDTVLAMALRNLAPVLHEDELKKYDVIIGSQPTMSDRAAFWRAQQGDSNGSVT